jgi:SAM-dependent methyltransferase
MTEIKDFSREYASKGAYHHQLSGFKARWIEHNYRLLADKVTGKVLDIACGDGRLADFIGASSEIDGFDIVPQAIELTKKKSRYRGLWVGHIEDPKNYLRDSYDYFICSLSLQYLTKGDLKKHFLMMKDILSLKGEYRFTYPNTKPEYAPALLTKDLKTIFSEVTAVPVTSFVSGADTMDDRTLEKAFIDAQRGPLEASYHYMVTLRD